MRRIVWLALALAACGESETARDPRCEDTPDTAWRCAGSYQATRDRCVDGQFEEDTCDASQWCLSWSESGAAPYEGRCVDRQIEGRCPSSGDCPDGLVCYKDTCRNSCVGVGVTCPIEGQSCFASDRPGYETPESLCVYEMEKP